MSKPKPPATLADAGSALWRDVVAKYDLRVDELAVLQVACETRDMIETIRAEWIEEGCPLRGKGSMGQPVTHPAVSDMKTHGAQLAKLLAQLKLPDVDPKAGTGPAVNPARAAADSRWKHGS